MKRNCRAFAATELMMLLAAMGIAGYVVSGLMNQVAKMNKKSAETSAILEIRNRINTINKSPELWLGKMRGKFNTFAGCIPDASTPRYIAGNFDCPPSLDFSTIDSGLAEKAGTSFNSSYAPVLDMQGDVLAGTADSPVYLDLNGKECAAADAARNCPFKSTGYFLRSSNDPTTNPGNVKFIVKIERNLDALAKFSSVFKPEYLGIEVGTAWRDSGEEGAPSGGIKIGYLSDGSSSYIKPGHQCGVGQVYVGANPAGNPICKNYPTDCGAKKSAALVSINSELICSDSGSCNDGEAFLGHFAGTGEPICNIPDAKCSDPAKPLQVGLTLAGAPNCVAVSTCDNSQKLSFDGNNFSCLVDTLAQECGDGLVMKGINSDNTLICEPSKVSSANLECPNGQYVYGIHSDGTVKCADLIVVTQEQRNCPDGKYVGGINNDGSVVCRDLASAPTTPTTTPSPATSTGAYRWQFVATYDDWAQSVPSNTCPTGVTASANVCTQPSRTCRRSCNKVANGSGRQPNKYNCEKYVCQWVP